MNTLEGRRHRGPDQQARNAKSYSRFGIMACTAVFGASFAPPGLALALMSSLFLIGAIASALAAGLTRERVWSDHLTRWDEAAALFVLSGVAGMFVDPAMLNMTAVP